jgi:hypothetical protein
MLLLNFLAAIFFTVSGPEQFLGPDTLYISTQHAKTDSLRENQILYRGKIWRNLYTAVVGDQFLFSTDYLTGSVSTSGKIFRNIPVKYDIYHDELITSTNHNLMVQLNKELIDSFTLTYGSNTYDFVRIDSAREFSGYVNILYDGTNSFYVKYKKNIELLAVDRKYDRFYDSHKMYLVRDSLTNQFAGRLQLYRLMGEYKKQVRSHVNRNKLQITRQRPESFVPVIKFYDNLQH